MRVAVGLGDQELEQRLRPALDAAEDVLVVAQCLAADQLLPLVEARDVDALVIGWTLHRLTDAVLDQLDRPGLTLVLLVAEPADVRWSERRAIVLPVEADAAHIRAALVEARPGVRRMQPPVHVRAAAERVSLKPADRAEPVA